MPNLGSSDTPVEGQSFGLPAGAELGEDNGELVIKDSSGTIILRRNETASEWQFEGTDLSGINAIDVGSASVGSGSIDDTEQLASSITNPVGFNQHVVFDGLIEPTTLSAQDILRIGGDSRTLLKVSAVVRNSTNAESVKLVYGLQDGSNQTVFSYRENSFRNQLSDPSWDQTKQEWTLSTTGTDAASAGEFILTVWATNSPSNVEVLV